ncbi:hypothetical protein BpHYR1_050333 [Brachionus plicatilis]|uniref:SWIM-type domain-containing protein n=1 Tax=Brachionus plicatilis TaxID=10195 RepID=A0A3M7RJ65_BRAPC|nr:hypothetical protein BpHYR1_050333 [Brachionus plicatilis]
MSQENSESSTTSLGRLKDEYDEANQTDNDADELPTKSFVALLNPGEKRYYNCSFCSKRLYILIYRTSLQVTLYIQDQEHEHEDNDKGIPTRIKEKVLSLYYDENKNAKDIGRWLRKHMNDDYIKLSDIQINNLINRSKRLLAQQDPGKSIENLQRWAESRSAIPDDDDTMFVVAKFYLEPNNVNFRIFMTTKGLISPTRYCTHAATDATYKLNWINFPLLIAGTTDKARSFHPFGILLSKTLNNQKINYIFQYFRDQWLTESNIGWNESYANGFPSINNALEATNDVIKDKATLRDRLPVRNFLKCMDELLSTWSEHRHPDFRTTTRFHQKPVLSTHEYTLGHDWVIYMVTSTDVNYEATKEGCRNYLNSTGPWATFKDYLSWNDSYKIIEINEQVWELSECSCQYWKKNYICKHVIGIIYELSKFDTFPALDLNIEQNAKRGRRKKASSALQRNSTGPLNRDAFNMLTQLVSNSETNDSQPVINELTNQSAPTKRPRGRPRKNKN